MELCVLTLLVLICKAALPRARHVQYLLIKHYLLGFNPRKFQGCNNQQCVGLVILLLIREDMIGYTISCAASYSLCAPSPKTFQQLIRGNAANEL